MRRFKWRRMEGLIVPDPIRVLIVEDNAADAELVLDLLQRAGFDPEYQRAETAREYLRCLDSQPDIILADGSLPQFDGLRALDLLRERGLDIPFLLVSGSIGEDLAVDAMKRGASDYLLKDRLARLGEAVRSALDRRRLRQERAWATEAMRKSEERYRLISEVTSDYAYSLFVERGGALTCEWITDAFTRITGFTLDEVNARGWESLCHVDDAESLRRRHQELFSGQSGVIEIRIVGKGGQVRWVRFSERPIWDQGEGRVIRIYGGAQDITAQKDLERQLLHSQKMEAIGQLAAGLAHDFNNLLTIITGCGELQGEELAAGNPSSENLQLILQAADRAAQLTRQLLAFSRRQVLEPRAISLNAIVSNLEKMLRRLIGENIELRTVLDADLGLAKVDPGQIEQTVVNLALNARDAMPNGGRLTIETASMNLTEASAGELTMVPAGEYVTFSVSDTGTGMDRETQARIFEPFFTTKEVGRGTGLGLSTVYGIVKQSGGEISVESALGRGTRLRIYLPKLQESETMVSVEPVPSASVRGSETILVVEDQSVVLELIRRTLTRRGYNVLAAGATQEALRISREHRGDIALLLTDIVMPHMSGPQLAEQVVRVRPGIKILYMSGYTDYAVGKQGPPAVLFQKPFTPSGLERKVREALDAPASKGQAT